MRDLYDTEIQKVARAFAEANYICANTRNTESGVKEAGKRIQHAFEKEGFMVSVDMAPCLIVLPNGRTASPNVEIIGFTNDPEDIQEFDHERKYEEVHRSKELGVKYDGDQGGYVNQQRRKDAARRGGKD